MPEDLLSTPGTRAGLKATLSLSSEAVLRQLCINRGIETFDKTRAELEQVVSSLIAALDDAGAGAELEPAAMARKPVAATVFEPAADLDEGVVYDRSQDESASWQESMLRERREDKLRIEELERELEALKQDQLEVQCKKHEQNNQCLAMDQAKNRLKELWSIAETDASDRLAFFMELEQQMSASPELIGCYDREIQRVTEIIPIVECITRREFLLQRLNDAVKKAQEGVLERGAQQQSFERQRADHQRAEFAAEVERLNDQLSNALTIFEKKYQRRFQWKGECYVEVVQADLATQLQWARTKAGPSPEPTQPAPQAAPAPDRTQRLVTTLTPGRVLSPRAQQAMERARAQRELASNALTSSPRRIPTRTASPARGRSPSRGRSPARAASPRRSWR